MDYEEYLTKVSEVDAGLMELRTQVAAIHDEIGKLWKKREELVAERVAGVSDEEILADEQLRRWLCAESGEAAYRRAARLQEAGLPEGLMRHGIDGREEYEGGGLPVLTLCLQREQAVDEIATFIPDWVKVWGLGRPRVPIDVLDAELSEHGRSWMVWWDVKPNRAIAARRTYGVEEGIYEGDLREVLIFIAKRAYLYDTSGEE